MILFLVEIDSDGGQRMFEEILGNLQSSHREFIDNVQDDFGAAVSEQVYEPMEQNLSTMEQTESMANVEKTRIQGILFEARSII